MHIARYKYGIVIDSGLSGSRIQIYKWQDPSSTRLSDDRTLLSLPPKITQEDGWTLKISPGVSTFGEKPARVWADHYAKLSKFAESKIPAAQHGETPVFVLSTAGMRLLPSQQQKAILRETCRGWQKNTNFFMPLCEDFVQTIDGETEGVYGWLGLNYLMGLFNAYEATQTADHASIGFMDMGGALTQIAFVPLAPEERKKHAEDLLTVALRNVNGETQEWRVFVETWLGFGANEARRRYLRLLIDVLAISPASSRVVNDPCMPKGAVSSFDHNGLAYEITGMGNYELCTRTIYPLLLKNVPCKDTPCLFNGIHGPKLNFEKDRFVGISEYWYTANDVFQSGGEYNFHGFNAKVRAFCESDWLAVLDRLLAGEYLKLDPEKFLKDACFKALWVISILHEGFDLPRLGVEVTQDVQTPEMDEASRAHVPFKLADSVNGEELSWTLGKMLLFASSQIEPTSKNSLAVGVHPSALSGKDFVAGGGASDDDSDDEMTAGHLAYLVVLVFLAALVLYVGRGRFGKLRWRKMAGAVPVLVRRRASEIASKIPGLSTYVHDRFSYSDVADRSFSLEEGNTLSFASSPPPHLLVLRTRSTINLSEEPESGPPRGIGLGLLNKPFVVPKRSPSNVIMGENRSLDSLHSVVSNSSINKYARGDRLD